jgi:hypothetical protein
VARLEGEILTWNAVPGAARYRVFRNGTPYLVTQETRTRLLLGRSTPFAEYQVMSVDSGGVESFLSEPARVDSGTQFARPVGAALEREHAGFTGAGYVRLTREANTRVIVPVHLACAGTYDVDARYANGSGPINTEAKTAIRTLRVDGREAGVLVMPQRGTNLWNDWGYGTTVRVSLTAGEHTLALVFTPQDENMDGRINTALLDHVRLTRIGACR